VVAVVAVVLFGDDLAGVLLQAAARTATVLSVKATTALLNPRFVNMCLL
jgi:hypothetical protein